MAGPEQCSHHLPCSAKNRLDAKKKTYGYRERDEALRQAFARELTFVARDPVVYVDKSGMEQRDDYAYGWNERGQRFDALKSERRLSADYT